MEEMILKESWTSPYTRTHKDDKYATPANFGELVEDPLVLHSMKNPLAESVVPLSSIEVE
jgi:hypothetical protein